MTLRHGTVGLLGLLVALAGCAGDEETSPSSDEQDLTSSKGGLGPEPTGEAARYPIVLAHGFDGSPTNKWGFYRVAEALEADGHRVYVATVPPYNSVADRAAYLADHVDAALDDGHERVHLVAHSMGGLDSRYVISTLGYGEVVASLSTISTPHRGSYVGDVVVSVIGGEASEGELLNGLASAWGLTFNELAENSDVHAALYDISEAAAPQFNENNPDDPRVHYQSWAGVSSVAGIKNPIDRPTCEENILGDYRRADVMDASLVPMASFTAHGFELRPNDGMVTVESAKWGHFRGCIPADHLDEVGQPKHDGPDSWTQFDHVRFYRNLAFDLTELEYELAGD